MKFRSWPAHLALAFVVIVLGVQAPAAHAATSPAPLPKTGPIALAVQVKHEPADLLAPVILTIALKNPGPMVLATFLTADLYQVEVFSASSKVWDSFYQHKAIDVHRTVSFPGGVTPLVQQIWDGRTNDRRSLEPGTYKIRISLTGVLVHPTLEVPVTFPSPIPIDAALKGKTNVAVTIAGTPKRGPFGPELDDGTTKIALSRALGLRAQGRFIVRGFVSRTLDATQFIVSDFAPAYENVEAHAPPPTPPPGAPGVLVRPTPNGTSNAAPQSEAPPRAAPSLPVLQTLPK